MEGNCLRAEKESQKKRRRDTEPNSRNHKSQRSQVFGNGKVGGKRENAGHGSHPSPQHLIFACAYENGDGCGDGFLTVKRLLDVVVTGTSDFRIQFVFGRVELSKLSRKMRLIARICGTMAESATDFGEGLTIASEKQPFRTTFKVPNLIQMFNFFGRNQKKRRKFRKIFLILSIIFKLQTLLHFGCCLTWSNWWARQGRASTGLNESPQLLQMQSFIRNFASNRCRRGSIIFLRWLSCSLRTNILYSQPAKDT